MRNKNANKCIVLRFLYFVLHARDGDACLLSVNVSETLFTWNALSRLCASCPQFPRRDVSFDARDARDYAID